MVSGMWSLKQEENNIIRVLRMTYDNTKILCTDMYVTWRNNQLPNKKKIYVLENVNMLFLQQDFGLNM